MQYGYFDDDAREYVITRPDTPQSWSNYLGTTEYAGIITNNAGGYGFCRSGARGRFLRLRFNGVPADQPGRYFYLRDNEDGDYWSASWQPVGKPLAEYRSVCRHGTGYTVIESEYRDIATEATYFIPLGKLFEYWILSVTNRSERARSISVFPYCEFSNQWDTRQDEVNLQYSLFIVRGERVRNLIGISIHDNLTRSADGDVGGDTAMRAWMALSGGEVSGHDTSRERFIGPYRGYHNPLAVEVGSCTDSDAYGDNACGCLQTDIVLAPGESRDIVVMLGVGDARSVGRRTVAEHGSFDRAQMELCALTTTWHARLGDLVVDTPDEALNHTINVWGSYNCHVTFAWSRSASLVYNGERDGLGFRDSVQDTLGVVSSIPEEVGSRLELMLTGQLSHGGAMPVIRPFEHRPGSETPTCPEELRSDDCLWFFNAIPELVAETGDLTFYERVLPFADRGEATVFGHLRRALDFNLERTGAHSLPCGLSADWNDCLRLGYHGESLFVAFQLRLGLSVYADIAERIEKAEERDWAIARRDELDAAISAVGWDGDWFLWAIGEDGTRYGSSRSAEGQVYLNTQLWSVLSGAATGVQARRCMEIVHERLATPFGLALCAPPFVKTSVDVMRAVVYNPGIKENAGIFNHTQGWGVMACCTLSDGDRAYEYLRTALPASYNDRAEIRGAEPYVCAQTTYSPVSPRAGVARTPWLTGAATWLYYGATRYLLGIRPEIAGLRIDPCIPRIWDGFTATRRFRSCRVMIQVRNPLHVSRGVSSIRLNGIPLKENLVPAELLASENTVEVTMGEGKYQTYSPMGGEVAAVDSR